MAVWIMGIVIAAIVIAVVVALGTSGPGARARKERRERYKLEDSGDRIGLAPDHVAAEAPAPLPELSPISRPYEPPPPPAFTPIAETQSARPTRRELGRMVMTPDGEMILTTPPFELRDAIFTRRAGRYVAAMYRRLPPWVVVCPKVRLDSLLTPTKPDGRDAEDWRTWRHRVRVRAIDFVLCDRRTWKPLLAVIIEGSSRTRIAVGSGAQAKDVAQLVTQFREVQKMMKRMGGMGSKRTAKKGRKGKKGKGSRMRRGMPDLKALQAGLELGYRLGW